jgi:hypothetical protein
MVDQTLPFVPLGHYIAHGKPMPNGFIAGFNSSFRDEFLSETRFSSLQEARQQTSAWKED